MSNVLKVSLQGAIRCRHNKGWGQRRIARELVVHRNTVKGYVEGGSNCATHPTAGSGGSAEPRCEGEVLDAKRWCQSLCGPFQVVVESRVKTD
jgi:hypothetical protein